MTISTQKPEDPNLLTSEECARRLGLSRNSLKLSAARGDLPSIMLRGRRLFVWSDVLAALRNSK